MERGAPAVMVKVKTLYTAKYLKEAVLFLVENYYKIVFEVLSGFDILSLVYQSRTSHVE